METGRYHVAAALCRALGVLYALLALAILPAVSLAWEMGPGRASPNPLMSIYLFPFIALWLSFSVLAGLVAYGFVFLKAWVRWAVLIVNAPQTLFGAQVLMVGLLHEPAGLLRLPGAAFICLSSVLGAIALLPWHPAVRRILR